MNHPYRDGSNRNDGSNNEAGNTHSERKAIVQAAWTQFATHGFEVPVESIAENAGVSTETVSRHFPRQSDLFIGVSDQFYSRAMEITVRHEDGWTTQAEAARTWRSFIHSLASLGFGALTPQVSPEALLKSAADHDFFTAMQPRQDRLLRELRTVVDKARAHNLVGPHVTTVSLMLGIASISRPVPSLPSHLAERQQGWMVDVFLRGLEPR